MLLIEMVEEKQLPGMFRRQHSYFPHKTRLKGQERNSELLGIHFPLLSTLQMTSPGDKTPEYPAISFYEEATLPKGRKQRNKIEIIKARQKEGTANYVYIKKSVT